MKNRSTAPASVAGKRVLVTGANSGIGYQAALELARGGAQVTLVCRHPGRGEDALRRLRAAVPAAQAELAVLDLGSLASIRRCAADQVASLRPLDVLINNAGVMTPPQRLETGDGFELQFGTNVLGHFALTALLMPALERAALSSADRPRIVTLSSIAHKHGRLDFSDLQSQKRYSPMRAYQQSKLADLMFAFELDRRLRQGGSRIMSVAAHPGVANTNLFRAGDYHPIEKRIREVFSAAIGLVLNTDVQGARPTVYAAVSPQVRDGGYYGPQGLLEMRGSTVGEAKIAQRAEDPAAAARLWQVCEELTGVRFKIGAA